MTKRSSFLYRAPRLNIINVWWTYTSFSTLRNFRLLLVRMFSPFGKRLVGLWNSSWRTWSTAFSGCEVGMKTAMKVTLNWMVQIRVMTNFSETGSQEIRLIWALRFTAIVKPWTPELSFRPLCFIQPDVAMRENWTCWLLELDEDRRGRQVIWLLHLRNVHAEMHRLSLKGRVMTFCYLINVCLLFWNKKWKATSALYFLGTLHSTLILGRHLPFPPTLARNAESSRQSKSNIFYWSFMINTHWSIRLQANLINSRSDCWLALLVQRHSRGVDL